MGYKRYNLQTKLLFVSKDVKFYEHIYLPFFSKQNVDVSPFFNEHLTTSDMPHEPYNPCSKYEIHDANNSDDSLSELDIDAPGPEL